MIGLIAAYSIFESESDCHRQRRNLVHVESVVQGRLEYAYRGGFVMSDNKEPSIAAGAILYVTFLLLTVAAFGLCVLLAYGVVAIIFRYAFDVHLPNPFWWLARPE